MKLISRKSFIIREIYNETSLGKRLVSLYTKNSCCFEQTMNEIAFPDFIYQSVDECDRISFEAVISLNKDSQYDSEP